MKTTGTRVLMQALAACLALLFCSAAPGRAQDTSQIGEPGADQPTDYALAKNWLANPAGKAPKSVDVFFLYPTQYFGNYKWCTVDNPDMRKGAQTIRDHHGPIFRAGNFYAPYYRQLGISKSGGLSNFEKSNASILAVPYVDCQRAFEYYLAHYNHGRPIIFAGHSQGTLITRDLLLWLKTAHPDVLKRTIAAYLIGFSITPDFVTQSGLKFASGRTDTGVIVSYNTESPGTTVNTFVDILPGGLAINPINWKRDATYAPKSESLGSRLALNGGAYTDHPHYADARLNPKRGTVESTAVLPSSGLFPPGVLHEFDYDLYWYDLQRNVEDRIAAWNRLHGAVAATTTTAAAALPPAGGPDTPTNYAVASNWMSKPAHATRAVDVFFLYPTCYFGKEKWCAANDPDMRKEADTLRDAHAPIFRSANFYAPYYRQLGLDYAQSLAGFQNLNAAVKAVPLVDCKRAFEYYLAHYNRGRPIIFASHSQGTIVTRELLLWIKRAHPDVLKRTVAAYLIGFSVGRGYADGLGMPLAEGRDDTGVLISWNTEAPGATANPLIDAIPGAVAINPINWKRDATYASKAQSLGSRMRTDDGRVVDRPHFADAQVDIKRGTVVTHAPVDGGPSWPKGVLHRYDYDIFWYDFQRNVDDRIRAWQRKHG